MIFALQFLDDLGQPVLTFSGWNRSRYVSGTGCSAGRSASWMPMDEQMFQILGDVHDRMSGNGTFRTPRNIARNSFIITPRFRRRQSGHQGRHRFAGQFPAGQTLGFIIGLHLGDQLVSLPWVLIIAIMLAVSPRELVQTSRWGRCFFSGPQPFSGRSTECSCTNTH